MGAGMSVDGMRLEFDAWRYLHNSEVKHFNGAAYWLNELGGLASAW
jgi:hypothetical protein